MIRNTRRNFLKTAGALGAVSALPLSACQGAPRVVVIGGGFGGATAAKYVKMFDPGIDVTLIEVNKTYATCPLSNTVYGGFHTVEEIIHGFKPMAGHGVKVVHDLVTRITPGKGAAGEGGKVMTKGGKTFEYDRLIVSPGIDFKSFPGYGPAEHGLVPHAWKAGPQTTLLRKQLLALEDGQNVIICPPPNPFRCPPGPYERTSMVAWYLKNHKPKSKVIVLDAKEKFSKMGLFKEGWAQHYTNIEWVAASKDGTVQRVDAKTRTAFTEFGEHKAGVLNFIPPQTAAKLGHDAGLTDKSGWCPIHLATFESKIHKGIHVLGDAAIASGMPKSGNAANTQAKVCAAAVARAVRGQTSGAPKTTNTCYSYITPEHAMSVTAVYELPAGAKKYTKVKGSGGLSPMDAGREFRKLEAKNAWGWYINIAEDIWG